MTMSVTMQGADRLAEDFETAVNKYPDLAGKALRRSGNRFKIHVRKLVREKVKSDKVLTSGFRVSQVKHSHNDMHVDFSAETGKNPHWHLVEEGHDFVIPLTYNKAPRRRGGEEIGRVSGMKVMPKARKGYEPTFKRDLEEMTDELLRKAGLL